MKIKYAIIKKLCGLSAKEMDLFLYLIRRENQSDGRVEGVYYRDVMKQAGMCKQSFYNALRGLEEKQIVTVERVSDMDYNVTILDNAFPTKESYHEGYVKLNKKIFRSKRFLKLKAPEKYMLFEFLKGTHENGRSMKIGVKRFYEKFMQLLGVSQRVIREYLHALREFFSIGIKDGMYYITYLHSVFRDEPGGKAEDEWYLEHLVRKECWRNHIAGDEKEIAGTAYLVKQYRQIGGGTKELIKILMNSIQQSVAGIERKERKLSEKYIHILVRRTLGLP